MSRAALANAIIVAVALGAGACQQQAPTTPPAAVAGAPVASIAPAPQQPASASATAAAPTPVAAADETPAGTGEASFRGFGKAAFGSGEEAVRSAWGRPLKAGAPAPGATCHFLLTDMSQAGRPSVAFMFEDGQFRRYDVSAAAPAAPGGFRVGDPLAGVLDKFAGRAETMPDKYVEGARNVTVSDPSQPDARLVFQGDADGRIIAWRIGLLPQVGYVEGCG